MLRAESEARAGNTLVCHSHTHTHTLSGATAQMWNLGKFPLLLLPWKLVSPFYKGVLFTSSTPLLTDSDLLLTAAFLIGIIIINISCKAAHTERQHLSPLTLNLAHANTTINQKKSLRCWHLRQLAVRLSYLFTLVSLQTANSVGSLWQRRKKFQTVGANILIVFYYVFFCGEVIDTKPPEPWLPSAELLGLTFPQWAHASELPVSSALSAEPLMSWINGSCSSRIGSDGISVPLPFYLFHRY